MVSTRPKAHLDCFAYHLHAENGVMYGDCDALSEMLCVCSSSGCPFYKNRTQYNDELVRIHGTSSIPRILSSYNGLTHARHYE